MKSLSRQLVAVGLITVLVAGLFTVVSCGLDLNSVRRSTALFLEPLCPAGRMDGWPAIPGWHMLFSGLLWLWAVGLGAIVAGIVLWLRGRRSGRSANGRSGGGQRSSPVTEASESTRETMLVVGSDRLGEGAGMSGDELRDFERRLRRSIEQRPHAETEEMLREAIAKLGTPLLLAAIDQPPDEVQIVGWDGIAADMTAARERMPPEHGGEPWQSVILALVYRNDYADTFINPSFALSAEMDRSTFEWRSSTMSEEQHRQWLADTRDLRSLPLRPHFRAYSGRERTRLVGLESLRSIQSWTPEREDWMRLSPAIQTARMLAAGLVLLRFCQVAERYLAEPGLPEALPAFLTVDQADWPMETNTVDYCIYAVRPIRGR